MIIYQAQPNKIYPIIVQSFGRKYCNIYNYKLTFEFQNQEDENFAVNENIIYYPPDINMIKSKTDKFFNKIYYREAFPKANSKQNIDFLHGIFSDKKLSKDERTDFVFTFIDNPINQIYNWFFYIKFIENKIKFFLNKKVETYEGFSVGKFEEMISIYSTKFSKIEEFIDEFIYNKSKQFFSYKNKKIYFIDQIVHCKELRSADFYGLINNQDNLLKSIHFLQKKLFISNLDLDDYKGESSLGAKIIDYRKKEIEDLLEEDLFFFKNKERELNDYLLRNS